MDAILKRAPAAHRAFLARLEAETVRDVRLVGIAVAGSLSSGTADNESDIDLQIVVEDGAYEKLLRERLSFIAQFGSVLSAFTGEHVGEPRLTIALFEEDLLHVDFKFVTLAMFAMERVEDPVVLWERSFLLSQAVRENPRTYPDVDVQWIEDRFWVWMHYIATKVRRGEKIEALDGFAWLRQMALSPMVCAAQGRPNRSSRFLEREAPGFAQKMASLHPRSPELTDLKDCLERCATVYRELRSACGGPPHPRTDAETAVMGYIAKL